MSRSSTLIPKRAIISLLSITCFSCFSFYPSKNLGAFGDAGAIVTNDDKIAEDVRVFRNYGSEKRYYNKVVGANSRLDEMQAGLLRVRLQHMKEITDERVRLCESRRDELIAYLNQKEIGTIIHYPIPPHLSEAYQYLGLKERALPITEQYAKEVVSIPLYNGMTEEEQDYVITCLNAFGKE